MLYPGGFGFWLGGVEFDLVFDNSSMEVSFLIGGTATVDWGDGTITTYTDDYATHTYSEGEFFGVNVTGTPITIQMVSTSCMRVNKLPATLTSFICMNSHLVYADCSNAHLLELLYLTGNQLTAIDLSNNTELVEAIIAVNNITHIDIRALSKLERFQAYNNPLTSIKISNINVINNCTFSSCGLTSAQINYILSKLAANNLYNGTAGLTQDVSTPPTGQGIIDKQTLESRNWAISI